MFRKNLDRSQRMPHQRGKIHLPLANLKKHLKNKQKLVKRLQKSVDKMKHRTYMQTINDSDLDEYEEILSTDDDKMKPDSLNLTQDPIDSNGHGKVTRNGSGNSAETENDDVGSSNALDETALTPDIDDNDVDFNQTNSEVQNSTETMVNSPLNNTAMSELATNTQPVNVVPSMPDNSVPSQHFLQSKPVSNGVTEFFRPEAKIDSEAELLQGKDSVGPEAHVFSDSTLLNDNDEASASATSNYIHIHTLPTLGVFPDSIVTSPPASSYKTVNVVPSMPDNSVSTKHSHEVKPVKLKLSCSKEVIAWDRKLMFFLSQRC